MAMNKPLALALTAFFIFAAAALFPTAAQNATVSLLATYGVQIDYNGRILTGDAAPFIVNGRTYVPLRLLMDNFGDKTIAWDAATQKVLISSRLGPMDDMYMQQITLRNLQITDLENRIKTLEAENAKLKGAQDDLAYLEDQMEDLSDELMDHYEDYDGKSFTITVTGNTERIELVVSTRETSWDDFTETEQKDFMKKICNDIWDEFGKATITGFIEDSHDTLAQFKVEPEKSITIIAALDLPELQTELNEDYGNYNAMTIVITLTGNEDKVVMTMTVDDAQWNALTTSAKEDLLDDINDDIWYVLEEADISGTVKDGSTTLSTYHVEADEQVDL